MSRSLRRASVRVWLALAMHVCLSRAFAPCGLLAPVLPRRAFGACSTQTGRPGRPRPLRAFPTTEEAGDVSTLEEGMAINTWEHLEECEASLHKYQLKLGAPVFPNVERPPLQSYPAPLDLTPADPEAAPVPLLKISDGPLFTAAECDAIVAEAEEREEWVIGGAWHKNQAFPGIDLPVEKLPRAMEFLQTALPCRLFPFLAEALPELCSDPGDLRVSDLFLVKYNEKLGQTALRQHQDKGIISVNLALNPSSAFEEGGTLIPSLGRVAKIEQGVALAHSSSIWHAGHPISGGTRVILVCFLVSTAHAEHMRRFQERAARLRNEGMLMPAKAAIRMATAVLSEHGYGEDVIHQRMSGCGMPPPHDKVEHQFKLIEDKIDELWRTCRARVRLLSLVRLKTGVLHWSRGELGLAFTELYKAGMHEVESLGGADAGHGVEESAQSAAAVDGPCGAEGGGAGYVSLAPAAWALIAAVCADGAKDSVVHWRCLSGSTSANDMAGSALEWFRRAAEESGEGGFEAVAANCDAWQTPYLNAQAADNVREMGEEEAEASRVGGSAALEPLEQLMSLCGEDKGSEGSMLHRLTGCHLEEWGELIYSVLDQAENAVAFYLEAEEGAGNSDLWQHEAVLERLDVLIAGEVEALRPLLEAEAQDMGRDARYLRPELCRSLLKHGALVEQTYGADERVLESFERAVLCDPADQEARLAAEYAREEALAGSDKP